MAKTSRAPVAPKVATFANPAPAAGGRGTVKAPPTAADFEALHARAEALEKDVARQRSLVEASQTLHSTLDLDALLGIILRIASEGVDAERGTVYLTSDDGTE